MLLASQFDSYCEVYWLGTPPGSRSVSGCNQIKRGKVSIHVNKTNAIIRQTNTYTSYTAMWHLPIQLCGILAFENTTMGELSFEIMIIRKKTLPVPNKVQSKYAWNTLPSYNQNVALSKIDIR